MMCVGMKLGTRCSQSGSPFLNLILQNWKTLSRYFRIYRGLSGLPVVGEGVGAQARAMGWPTQIGTPFHCPFWSLLFFSVGPPGQQVSKIAENEGELAPGNGLGEMINLYWKTPVPDSPFVGWTPEGHGRRQATLIFTRISGTSQ